MKPHSTASPELTGKVARHTGRKKARVGHPPVLHGIGPFHSTPIFPLMRSHTPIPGLMSSLEAPSGLFRCVGQIRGLPHG